MGCFSSKIGTRATTIREEFSRSLKRRTNGFPPIETVLFKLKNDDKEVLLLNSESEEDVPSPEKPLETINLWQLMNGLDEDVKQEDKEQQQQQQHHQKSPILGKKFHTVEEYDAIVLAAKKQDQENIDHDLHVVNWFSRNSSSQSDDHECFEDTDRTNIREELKEEEKGARRKSMAKQLKPLDVQSFDFTPMENGSLRDWIGMGGEQAFSSGSSYGTPKFGKSGSRGSGFGSFGSSGISPELIAGLEEAMKELAEEEELILKQMLDRVL